jgi:hypothetical protein
MKWLLFLATSLLLAACVALPPEEKATPAPGGETATPVATSPKGAEPATGTETVTPSGPPYPAGWSSPTWWPTPMQPPFPPGYVPPPSWTPWPTWTPGPSPTPPPTDTPWPTPVPTSLPTVVPPIVTVDPGRLPPIPHDLFFLRGYTLVRWNHVTGQLETLEGPRGARVPGLGAPSLEGPPLGAVLWFDLAPDGQHVVLFRRALYDNTYEFAMLDVSTHQVTVLVQRGQDDLAMKALSPDGQWVSYGVVEYPTRAPGPAARARGPLPGGVNSFRLYALRVDAPEQVVEIGLCATVAMGVCRGSAWSPDSRTLAWSDARGVWLAEPGQAPRLALARTEPDLQYAVQSWSPAGRFLLLGRMVDPTVVYPDRQRVFDTVSGRFPEVPGAGENQPWTVHMAWLPDGRLFVAGPGVNGLQGQVWRVDPQEAALLVHDNGFAIPAQTGSRVAGVTGFADGRLAFALVNASPTEYAERGLYVVDPGNVLRKMNGLPPEPYGSLAVFWAADGAGALVSGSWPEALYAPSDGSALYDLMLIGLNPWSARWGP